MSSLKPSNPVVVVIGGGVTGTGVARDAAMRGFKVVLVERGELGSGTSGHFHGLLHSGARYAAIDHKAARECYEENQILRNVAPSAITDTGGIFVAFDQEESSYADIVRKACSKVGIPTEEISGAETIQREPLINTKLIRAFAVPDAYINGVRLVQLNHQAALNAATPATFLAHHAAVGLIINDNKITAVSVKNTKTNSIDEIKCDYVISAAGAWAATVAELASIKLAMIYDKGTMIVFEDQFNSSVINRCRPQSDGDILVPDGVHSIMGTTARHITDLDNCQASLEEISLLHIESIKIIPSLKNAAVKRIYAGIRPLYDDGQVRKAGTGTRTISRSFHLIDHDNAGIANFISIVGGKVTIYRRMAEAAVDLLCQKSNKHQVCRTAKIIM